MKANAFFVIAFLLITLSACTSAVHEMGSSPYPYPEHWEEENRWCRLHGMDGVPPFSQLEGQCQRQNCTTNAANVTRCTTYFVPIPEIEPYHEVINGTI